MYIKLMENEIRFRFNPYIRGYTKSYLVYYGLSEMAQEVVECLY